MRAIQGHSRTNKVDPSLLRNVEIRNMWSEYIYHVGSSLVLHFTIYSRLITGGKIQQKEDKPYSSQPLNLWLILKKMNHTTRQNHDKYRTKQSGKSIKMLYIESIWKVLKMKDERSGKLDSMRFSFTTLCQPTDLKHWWIPTLTRFCNRNSLSPRAPAKTILKDTWQVQREYYHQRRTEAERLLADDAKTESKIDCRIQSVPHAAIEHRSSFVVVSTGDSSSCDSWHPWMQSKHRKCSNACNSWSKQRRNSWMRAEMPSKRWSKFRPGLHRWTKRSSGLYDVEQQLINCGVLVFSGGWTWDGGEKTWRLSWWKLTREPSIKSCQQKSKSKKKQKQNKNCLLNPCNVVAQLVTSQPDAVDTTMTFMWYTDVMGPSRISWNQHVSSSAQRTFYTFCVVSHSCMVAEQVILELRYHAGQNKYSYK